jgi:hypothetical protein
LLLFTSLAISLAVIMMVLGAVWSRLRKLSRPLVETARLVDDLTHRQRALESVLARLDGKATTAKRGPTMPPHRVDRPEPGAATGPTLIAIPNLAATPAEVTAAASAAAELAHRFGAIWAMSEIGASAEVIARETGQPIGQIELILGLRRQLAGGSTGGRP